MLRLTNGLVRLRLHNSHLWLTDLRMGQEGAYVFDFDLGPPLAPGHNAPVAVQHSARMGGADLAPLSAGIHTHKTTFRN